MERGIQRGLVMRNSRRTQKTRPARITITLDCRNTSSRKISEKSRNLRRNFAAVRILLHKPEI